MVMNRFVDCLHSSKIAATTRLNTPFVINSNSVRRRGNEERQRDGSKTLEEAGEQKANWGFFGGGCRHFSLWSRWIDWIQQVTKQFWGNGGEQQRVAILLLRSLSLSLIFIHLHCTKLPIHLMNLAICRYYYSASAVRFDSYWERALVAYLSN